MAKAQEDMDDLKFQLEEKNIEFEGTRAQLRVLESKSKLRPDPLTRSCSSLVGSHEELEEDERLRNRNGSTRSGRVAMVSTPSMQNMVPLVLTDDVQFQHSSSTESAHDHTEQQRLQQQQDSTPKKRIPSRIPLPGMAAVTTAVKAPKPPSGRKATGSSGPPSNRSLNQNRQISTSNTSLNRKELSSLTRPESAQSWRNSYPTAPATNATSSVKESPTATSSPSRHLSSSGSSIPVSVNSVGSNGGGFAATKPAPIVPLSPVKTTTSAGGTSNRLLKSQKPQETNAGGTLRGRNLMDSLTSQGQLVKSPSNSMSSKLSTTSSTPITMILNNKQPVQLRDKSHSQSNVPSTILVSGSRNGAGSTIKTSAVPVRRASSRTSIGSGSEIGTTGNTDNDNGKVRNLRSSIWNWLKI